MERVIENDHNNFTYRTLNLFYDIEKSPRQVGRGRIIDQSLKLIFFSNINVCLYNKKTYIMDSLYNLRRRGEVL